jgi:hypothetical protein
MMMKGGVNGFKAEPGISTSAVEMGVFSSAATPSEIE